MFICGVLLLFNVEFVSAAYSVVFLCLYVEYCYCLMLSLLVLLIV